METCSSQALVLLPLDVDLWQHQPTLALGQTQTLRASSASKSKAILCLLPLWGFANQAYHRVTHEGMKKGRIANMQSESSNSARLLVSIHWLVLEN